MIKTIKPLRNFFVFSVLVLNTGMAIASPESFNYQGRIVGSNGTPLEYSAVAFEFSITNPAGSCILYREILSNVDMRNSNGIFDTTIGAGTKVFPSSSTTNLVHVFNNSDPLPCEGGSVFSPSINDFRKLRVQFHDGIGWKLISPDSIIRSVPYASHAGNALRLANKTVQSFLLKSDLPSPCGASEVLTWNGAAFTCVQDSTGSTLPTSMPPSGAAGGVLSGTYPNPGIATGAVTSAHILNGTVAPVDLAAGGGSGQTLRFDGVNWQHAKLNYTDLVNANGSSPWPASACSAGEFLTWVSVTDGFGCASPATFTELDPKVGSNTPNHLSRWNGSALVASDIVDNAGKIGIGISNPQATLDVAGEIKTTTTGLNCSGTTEGSLRYNQTLKRMEFCNGTQWLATVISEGPEPGAISAYATSVCPTGWVAANGALVSRSNYASLFAAISTTYGPGDGVSTFKLPDYRGYFLRGWDHGAGADPDSIGRVDRGDGTSGDAVGTKQDSEARVIIKASLDEAVSDVPIAGYYFGDLKPNTTKMYSSTANSSVPIQGNDATETRPKNISVLYCVKY